MKKVVLVLMMLMMVGCAETAEPSTTPLPTTAVQEVPPTLTQEAQPTITPTSENSVETGVAYPVTVNIGELTPIETVESTPQVMPAPGVPDPTAALVHQISQELATKLSIDVSEVELVSVEEVTWPDSSLGCPQPGQAALDVLTPGFRVILAAQGQEYEYHTQDTSQFVLCAE